MVLKGGYMQFDQQALIREMKRLSALNNKLEEQVYALAEGNVLSDEDLRQENIKLKELLEKVIECECTVENDMTEGGLYVIKIGEDLINEILETV